MSKTIMIVDDALSIRGLIRMTLENAGYAVIEANHGAEALRKLRERTDEGAGSVDLIILDIYMPEMDGMELLRTLKADPKQKFIPIVVLTKEADAAMKRKGQSAGAKAWIVKPFKPRTILDVVTKIIGPESARN